MAAKKSDTWMPFYVTDYLGDTMHLSTVQHGAYLLLLLACWKAGGALPDDDGQLSAITRMPMADWRKSAQVLKAFFTPTDGRLEHGRVMKELVRAQELSDKRTAVGKLGGRPPKDKQTETNRFPDSEAKGKQTETHAGVRSLPSPSQENIQPPTPSGVAPPAKRAKAIPATRPDDVSEQTWSDWVAHRAVKKATVTRTVVDGARDEAKKAGMSLDAFLAVWCRRGSIGLEADWLKPHERGSTAHAPESFRERDARIASERVAVATGGLAHDRSALKPRTPDFTEIIEGIPHEQARIA